MNDGFAVEGLGLRVWAWVLGLEFRVQGCLLKV